ncbi:MAG: hypothetical protein EZS28_020509 [Streblomastix strix]|uniref:Uncharacterized protein n=1 Tax=Streblomastix strix TaxID=222440 RepID=A0A5J4VNK5_9EUKA|nr:MAG: hypothetical protein EZS28_020509 [Streblomastix strix]
MDYQARRLRYSTGPGEGISPFESERGLVEIHEIQVKSEILLLCRPFFWLEPESTAILQSNEFNSYGNQGEVLRESGIINGRPIDLIIGKETTGMRYSLDNLIHEGAVLEEVISQVQVTPTRDFQFLGWRLKICTMEVCIPQDNSKYLKLKLRKWLEITMEKKIIEVRRLAQLQGELNFLRLQVMDASLHMVSINRVKTEMLRKQGWNGRQKLDRRMLGDLRCWEQSNDGCGDKRMGSGIGGNGGEEGIGGECRRVEWDLELEVFKLVRNDSGVNRTKFNEKQLSELDCNDCQHGQCGNGVEHQQKESQMTDLITGEKDPISGDIHGCTATDTTHSGSGEQYSGSNEQDINEGGLLDQTESTKRSTIPVRTSSMVGRLRDKNEQTITKILLLVYKQRSIQSQRTKHELNNTRLSAAPGKGGCHSTNESQIGQK